MIISRGATAGLIEMHFPEIVSIRAEPDNLEVIETLIQGTQYGNQIGLLLYEEYINSFKGETVRNILDMQNLPYIRFAPEKISLTRSIKAKRWIGCDGRRGTLAERTREAL